MAYQPPDYDPGYDQGVPLRQGGGYQQPRPPSVASSVFTTGRPYATGTYRGSQPSIAPSIRSKGGLSMSQMSMKSEFIIESQRKVQHQRLNKSGLGKGRAPLVVSVYVGIGASLLIILGGILVGLENTQKIFVQDQLEFVGPGLIGVGMALMGAAAYGCLYARRISNKERRNIRFRSAGVRSVSAVNLAYEPENKGDMVTGTKTSNAFRTPLASEAGWVTPGLSPGPMTPGIGGFTYNSRQFAPTPGATSMGAMSVSARAMTYNKKLPNFATPGLYVPEPSMTTDARSSVTNEPVEHQHQQPPYQQHQPGQYHHQQQQQGYYAPQGQGQAHYETYGQHQVDVRDEQQLLQHQAAPAQGYPQAGAPRTPEPAAPPSHPASAGGTGERRIIRRRPGGGPAAVVVQQPTAHQVQPSQESEVL